MNGIRRQLSLCALAAALAACTSFAPSSSAPSSEVAAALAPSGKLRVGVYVGSPTSYIAGEAGARPRGVGYELGERLAQRAGLPFEPVVFPSNEKLQEAAREAKVDIVFTNATPARAQFLDFTPTVLSIDKSYLVPPGSTVRSASELDRADARIGVSRGSTTEGELKRVLKNATFVPQPSLDETVRALSERRIDAFASNNAILHQLSDRLPGSRVLDGRWGTETFALGIPKGRAAAMPYLDRFVEDEREGGVRAAAERAGVRGLSKEKP